MTSTPKRSRRQDTLIQEAFEFISYCKSPQTSIINISNNNSDLANETEETFLPGRSNNTEVSTPQSSQIQCFYCGKITSITRTGNTRQHNITLPGDNERSICPGSSPCRGGGNSKLNARLETSLTRNNTIGITTNHLPTPTNDTNVAINDRFQITMIVQNVRSIKAYKSNYKKQDPFGLEGWYEFTSHLKGHRGGVDVACIVETKCKGNLIKWDCRESGYLVYIYLFI